MATELAATGKIAQFTHSPRASVENSRRCSARSEFVHTRTGTEWARFTHDPKLAPIQVGWLEHQPADRSVPTWSRAHRRALNDAFIVRVAPPVPGALQRGYRSPDHLDDQDHRYAVVGGAGLPSSAVVVDLCAGHDAVE